MVPQLVTDRTGSSAGDSVTEVLDSIRAKEGGKVNYLGGVLIRMTLNLTSASTSDAIAQSQWAGLLNQLDLLDQTGKPLFVTPLSWAYFRESNRYLMRRGPSDAPALAANSNDTVDHVINVLVPFKLRLRDRMAGLMPSAFLREVRLRFGASTLFGTGQTINSIRTQIFVLHDQHQKLEVAPRIRYGKYTLDKFANQSVKIGDGGGALLNYGVADLAAGGTTTIGATDFTDVEVFGRSVNLNRMPVDCPVDVYNEMLDRGDADDARIGRPTDGAEFSFPLYTHPDGEKLSRIPFESALTTTLVTGAGSPGLTDQDIIYALLERRDSNLFAQNMAMAPGFVTNEPRRVLLGIEKSGQAKGNRGGVDVLDPVEPFLRQQVNTKAITRGA